MTKIFFSIIITLLSFSLLANEDIIKDFSSPRGTMNYFLKNMKKHKLGKTDAIDLAIESFNLKNLDEHAGEIFARNSAKSLINTLDRIEYIKIETIPLQVNGDTWIYKKRKTSEGKEIRIAISKTEEDLWKFTPDTLENIKIYERLVKNNKLADGVVELNDLSAKIKRMMPAWTGKKTLILLNGQWLGIFLLIFLGILIDKIIKNYVGSILKKVLLKKSINFSNKHKKKLAFPLSLITITAIWPIGIRFLEIEHTTLSILLRISQIIFSIGVVFTSHHIVDIIASFFQAKAKESENKFDDILVPLLARTAKFFVIAIGIVFIGDSLTINMKNVLAGLGIGGIAFALAAKDTISNIFGSVTVLLDRPFSIGDWIVVDGKIEGVIEDVGLRSTRIRTFYDSLITLPNGQLTNVHIDNYGRRNFRRFSTKINIEYNTPTEKIEAFCQAIRSLIERYPYTKKDNYQVHLNSFSSSSIDILVYVFWTVPNWSSELEQRHRLLLDILKLAKEMGVNMAFPTQTLHLFNEQHAQSENINSGEIPNYAKNKADKVFNDYFQEKNI